MSATNIQKNILPSKLFIVINSYTFTMHQNIKINNTKSINAKLYNGNYYDFMLYKGETLSQSIDEINEITMADFSDLNITSGVLYSNISWSGATNEGVEMDDIGFTGMDNGLISFRKDRITNAEFLDLLINSEYKIESGDTRLFLTPITGNTQRYEYPMFLYEDENEKYIACKGGFYQGFFKLVGHNYQVLPHNIDNEWVMHFNLRPRSDYKVDGNLINFHHKNNEGIFFFMGTRAENKFWPFYKTNSALTENFKVINSSTDGYFDGCGEISGETYNANENNVVFLENDWIAEEIDKTIEESYFAVGDGYFAFNNEVSDKFKPSSNKIIGKPDYFNDDYLYHKTEAKYEETKEKIDYKPCNIEYFSDEYYDTRCPEKDNNKAFADEYIGSGATIDVFGYDDSMGHAMSATGYQEIVTDNKFLLFDRTPSGFTVDNWVEGTNIILTRRQNWPNANYFLLMNRTPTGYTVDTINRYNETHQYDYNIHKDIRGNVFALRVKEDGSIGYRYGVIDCENDNRYSVIEEYSKPGLVKKDEWNKITVKYVVINPSNIPNDNRPREMKIMFYLNGNLIFVSKTLDAFRFKEIDEVSQKQEAVPYNISLGGGTLGLLESILPNYYAISDYILPIERDFCGTFMGDIKTFKIYGNNINYNSIKNMI